MISTPCCARQRHLSLLFTACAEVQCSAIALHLTLDSPAGLDLLPLSDPMHLKMAESLGAGSCASSLECSPESLQLTHVMQAHSLVPCLPPAGLALGCDRPASGVLFSVSMPSRSLAESCIIQHLLEVQSENVLF